MYEASMPPLPWSYQTNAREGDHEGNGFVYLLDANNRKIASFWGKPGEKMAMAETICRHSDNLIRGAIESERLEKTE